MRRWHRRSSPTTSSTPTPSTYGRVNGETKQDSNTDQFIFDVGEMIEYVSDVMTLRPGDGFDLRDADTGPHVCPIVGPQSRVGPDGQDVAGGFDRSAGDVDDFTVQSRADVLDLVGKLVYLDCFDLHGWFGSKPVTVGDRPWVMPVQLPGR